MCKWTEGTEGMNLRFDTNVAYPESHNICPPSQKPDLMTSDSSSWCGLVTAVTTLWSTLSAVAVEAVHRLMTHFEEWPERYIEQQAALYEDNY